MSNFNARALRKNMTDAERWLEDKGWRVLRFWNNDVLAAPNPHPPNPNGLAPPSPASGRGDRSSEKSRISYVFPCLVDDDLVANLKRQLGRLLKR